MSSRTDTDGGGLQELLLRCCRPDERGRRSIALLATQLGVTSAAIYKWLKTNHLPSWQAGNLVENSQGEVTLDLFLPYVFKK